MQGEPSKHPVIVGKFRAHGDHPAPSRLPEQASKQFAECTKGLTQCPPLLQVAQKTLAMQTAVGLVTLVPACHGMDSV